MIAPGTKFGFLTVIEEMSAAAAGKPPGSARWSRCRCVCGKRITVRSRHLRYRAKHWINVSCGCRAPLHTRMSQIARAA